MEDNYNTFPKHQNAGRWINNCRHEVGFKTQAHSTWQNLAALRVTFCLGLKINAHFTASLWFSASSKSELNWSALICFNKMDLWSSWRKTADTAQLIQCVQQYCSSRNRKGPETHWLIWRLELFLFIWFIHICYHAVLSVVWGGQAPVSSARGHPLGFCLSGELYGFYPFKRVSQHVTWMKGKL